MPQPSLNSVVLEWIFSECQHAIQPDILQQASQGPQKEHLQKAQKSLIQQPDKILLKYET